MLASILEQMENQPGALSSAVISSGASMAISHIRRLEAALEQIARTPNLDYRNSAREALGEQPIDPHGYGDIG